MTGPSLSILRYGVKPSFPGPKPVPARIRVTGRQGAYRWTCTVCIGPGMALSTPGRAADAGRSHLRRWHS